MKSQLSQLQGRWIVRFDRTLIVLKDYLGDTVMASPLVRSIAAESKSTELIGSLVIESLLQFPDFRAKCFPAGNLGNVAQLLSMAKRVRTGSYQAAFLVNRSFRSALLVRLAGVPKRIGHATEGRGFLLTTKLRYDMDRNEAQCYLDMARAIDLPLSVTMPELWISDAERINGRSLISSATVGIQPGARHPFKEVPAAVWRDVGQKLTASGHRLAFFGGQEEQGQMEALGLEGIDLIGKTTIRETLGALAGLKLMIGGDTGVMHMAAAIGTPTVTIFGPTPAKKWGWFHDPHQVLQARENKIENIEAQTILNAVEKALCVTV